MRNSLKYTLLTWVLLLSIASATTINVPADSTTIQAAINGATDGDTVLVQPAIYVENINFNGRNVVVGSLFLTTGDTTFISSTIIDGDSSGSVVTFENGEDSTAVLAGFTITNGFADYGGGMYCYYSSPYLDNVKVIANTANRGGGISCNRSSLSLNNVVVGTNTADRGGGIYCENNSSPMFFAAIVCRNSANLGGGIHCTLSSPRFYGATVRENFARDEGGGILCRNSSNPSFDSENRSNIYFNHSPQGTDLYAYDCETISVTVDTFTVMNPTDYHAYPAYNFTFNILHGKVEQVESDLYVSPEGDDANSGQSPAEPLKSISLALVRISADSLHHQKIYISNGLYSPSATGEIFPLNMRSFVILSGESETGAILDGENQSTVLVFNQDSTAMVENLSIQGGSARLGGGIYSIHSSPSIFNVSMNGNWADDGGGGIYCYRSSLSLSNMSVTGNLAGDGDGGGILCSFSSLSLSNVTLNNNTADNRGGGIRINNSNIWFDAHNRCSIYSNHAATGSDLYASDATIIAVVVDTFSVINPTVYHACPRDNFTFDILHPTVEQVESDLYVSPEGNDANSGQSPAEPLKTISFAQSIILSDSLHPRTIHLSMGTYAPSSTGENFPLHIIDYISLSGASAEGVILDAEGHSKVMYFDQMKGVTLSNLTITGGSANLGGGIYCKNNSHLSLSNVTIWGNSAAYSGGGLFCRESSISLSHVTINGNSADEGGGIKCLSSQVNLSNVTITGNYAIEGGGINSPSSWIALVNTILWNDSRQEIYHSAHSDTGDFLTMAYSDIQGGKDGIITTHPSAIRWLDGNIDSDPLFIDAAAGNFHLQEGSPCVDAGTSLFVWEGDTLVNLPDSAFKGNATDMGVYESPYTMQVSEYEIMPTEFALRQNYPNPFNPISTIRYDLPKGSEVSLVVYDILGREVARLVDSYMEPGYHWIQWDGRDAIGREVPSGIYIARLLTPEYTKSIKMVLLR